MYNEESGSFVIGVYAGTPGNDGWNCSSNVFGSRRDAQERKFELEKKNPRMTFKVFASGMWCGTVRK